MTVYRVELVRSSARELERLPVPARQRVLRAIQGLQKVPRPTGSRKLTGAEATYRLRVGPYRVVYEVDDRSHLVLITRIRHRKDAYS